MNKLKKSKLTKPLIGIICFVIFIGLYFVKEGFNNSSVDNTAALALAKNDPTKKPLNNKKSSRQDKITIDLTGAVKSENIYQVVNGARLQDAINRAGGLLANANLKAINRAQILHDEDKIYIPFIGEEVPTADIKSSSTTNNNDETGKVNLNTADLTQLQTLNGIGEKKAQQIIDFRTENGAFKEVHDLTKVTGIGEKTFASLADQITI